jgi:hypothetical protein
MAFLDMRTCPHIGPKLACRRPGTKYCVDLFFYFRTLWNPPPVHPLMLIFLPLALRPNISPWSLFPCQCSRLPVHDHPPPTSVSIARQRAVRCRGRWRLCRCCVVVVNGGGGGRGGRRSAAAAAAFMRNYQTGRHSSSGGGVGNGSPLVGWRTHQQHLTLSLPFVFFCLGI